MLKTFTFATAFAAFGMFGAVSAETIKLGNVAELSGGGATVGQSWTDAINMGTDEINAVGGVLGMPLEIATYDSQTDAQVSRALVQKAIDDGAFMILGTVYSSSTIVNMLVTMQQGVPQVTGSSSPTITEKGNPFIFRTELSAKKAMPRIVRYMDEVLGVKKVAISWVNNEFGKGGHDSFVEEMQARGIKVTADVSSEVGQADFAADVTKLKSSGADAVFVFLHEEESARMLKELRKQNIEVPIVGDNTLLNQKVIELADGAADGVIGHVSLTAEADTPEIQAFSKSFLDRYGYKADHNAMKGYAAIYAVATAIERVGELDRQKVADMLHNTTINVADVPGILLDSSWDDTGDLVRGSFMVEVKDGGTIVRDVLSAN